MEIEDQKGTTLSSVVFYGRSATGHPTALRFQEAACAAYAAYADGNFRGFQRCYADVGRALGPDMQVLLGEAKAGRFMALVVTDPDRLSRNTRDLLAIFAKLEDAGVEVHMPRCGRVDLVTLLLLNIVGWREERCRRVPGVFDMMEAAYALPRLPISGRAK